MQIKSILTIHSRLSPATPILSIHTTKVIRQKVKLVISINLVKDSKSKDNKSFTSNLIMRLSKPLINNRPLWTKYLNKLRKISSRMNVDLKLIKIKMSWPSFSWTPMRQLLEARECNHSLLKIKGTVTLTSRIKIYLRLLKRISKQKH